MSSLSFDKNELYLAKSHVGLGVFTNISIPKGTLILNFSGITLNKKQLIGKDDHHLLQISNETYIEVVGPEKFVNHSCEPNAGLKTQTALISLRDITINEEIVFDYATSINDDWRMDCTCKSSTCRGFVSNFKDLPPQLRTFFMQAHAVPSWLLEGENKQ